MTRAEFVAMTVSRLMERRFHDSDDAICFAVALADKLEATRDCPWLAPRPYDPDCAYCVAAPDRICQAHREQVRRARTS